MEEFLRYIIGNLTGTPEGMELTQRQSRDTVYFRLNLPRSEVGKLVGKQGRTIEAIRNLLCTAAAHKGQRATLQIVEI